MPKFDKQISRSVGVVVVVLVHISCVFCCQSFQMSQVNGQKQSFTAIIVLLYSCILQTTNEAAASFVHVFYYGLPNTP